jgi:mycoredoxin
VAKLELYGTPACPYTRDLREWLEWKRSEFVEYDVETDRNARERMSTLTGGQLMVPVLVEEGRVVQIGSQGRGCVISQD